MKDVNKEIQISNYFGFLTLSIFIFSMLFIAYGADGVRGTDQYWYLADTKTVTEGSAPITNVFYPAKILREAKLGPKPNYFMHNGPLLSMAAYFAQYLGIFYSWILLNVISHALCAIAIYTISKKYTTIDVAAWTTCLYIFSPIAIWQTLNLLQEQAYSGILAVAFIGFVFRRNLTVHVLFLLTLVLGILSHPIFTALAFSYSIFLIIESIKTKKTPLIILGVTTLVVFALTKHYTDVLYPSSFQPDLSSIITGAVPGVSNMLWHYSDVPHPITADLFLKKIIYAAQTHFLELRSAPLFFYTNIAFICGIFLLLFRFRTYREIILTTGLALTLYTAILVLMQTQARYQQIVSPASFVIIAISLYELRNRISINLFRLLGTALLLVSILVSAFMAHKTRSQSQLEAIAINNIQRELQFIPEYSRVLTIDSEHELKLSYILRPRDVLVARSDLIKSRSLVTAIKLFKPAYLVSTNQSQPNYLGIDTEYIVENEYLGNIHIYKLKPTFLKN